MKAWARRALNFQDGELGLALLAAVAYFCVLAGYGLLRPVREAMGVSRGMDDLRWLFAATSVASLVFVLAFGGAISRLDRRRVVPLAYGIVIVCLLGFAALLAADAWSGGELIGSSTQTRLALVVGYTFFIWLTVINLFVNSILWGFLADVFDVDQGKRIFPFIGMGGTLGALAGGWAAKAASDQNASNWLPIGLMLAGAALFAAATGAVACLDRAAVASRASGLRATHGGTGTAAHARVLIGGTYSDGMTALMRSPYLLGIGGYIVLMAVANTLLYFTQVNVVLEKSDTFSQRVGDFAYLDFMAQCATLLTQVFVTTHLIRRLGVGWTLAILPMVTFAGFAVLAIWPLFGVLAVFQAVHRASRFAIARPARETLFSVVPPADKYKAKPVIDVFLYRGGDLAGMGLSKLLAWAGLGMVALALSAVPLALAWGGLSVALGRAQARRGRT
jgi:ATP:ADP antiporter, AAA family